jgi:hypothetical protein
MTTPLSRPRVEDEAMASAATDIADLIARWDANEGKPYKGTLIDWAAYEADPDNIGCMCAQGQVLHVIGGMTASAIREIGGQSEADAQTAKLLNISRCHAILLRNVNDNADGAPSIVLTNPGKVLGDQWSKLLDFWWAFDQFDTAQWKKVAAARAAAWAAAGDAAGAAARAAAGDAARAAAGAAAWAAAWAAAGDAAGDAARAAAGDAARAADWAAAGAAAGAAAWEIQGFAVLTQRGRDVFFLPMLGWGSPADIPARPADYGNGAVPVGEAA